MAVGHTAKQTTHASAVMTQDIRLRSTGKVNCKYTKQCLKKPLVGVLG